MEVTNRMRHEIRPEKIDEIATAIIERVFATLKPSVSQYPNGVQIGSIFIRPEEKGYRYALSVEVDSESDEDQPEQFLELIEDAYSLPWAITRAIVLQLEPQIEIASFDVVKEIERKDAENADQSH